MCPGLESEGRTGDVERPPRMGGRCPLGGGGGAAVFELKNVDGLGLRKPLCPVGGGERN